MVKNQTLLDAVAAALCKHAQKDPGFNLMSEGDEELGKELIKSMGNVQVDKEYKIRVSIGKLLGYGYDFSKPAEDGSSQKMYERAVKNTKALSGSPHFETFVDAGVIDDKIGWYITKL